MKKVNQKNYLRMMIMACISTMVQGVFLLLAMILTIYAMSEWIIPLFIASLFFCCLIYSNIVTMSKFPLVEWSAETNCFRLRYVYKSTDWMALEKAEIIPWHQVSITNPRKYVFVKYEGDPLFLLAIFSFRSLQLNHGVNKERHVFILKQDKYSQPFIDSVTREEG